MLINLNIFLDNVYSRISSFIRYIRNTYNLIINATIISNKNKNETVSRYIVNLYDILDIV